VRFLHFFRRRYREQHVRAMRGQLRQLPGQTGQVHQLRASFGDAREQMLRRVPALYVRDAGLQLCAVPSYLRDLQRHGG